MTEKQKKAIYKDVLGMLENAVQDIYLEAQKGLHISNGENPIDYGIDEIVATDKLARVITETLVWQKGEE